MFYFTSIKPSVEIPICFWCYTFPLVQVSHLNAKIYIRWRLKSHVYTTNFEKAQSSHLLPQRISAKMSHWASDLWLPTTKLTFPLLWLLQEPWFRNKTSSANVKAYYTVLWTHRDGILELTWLICKAPFMQGIFQGTFYARHLSRHLFYRCLRF